MKLFSGITERTLMLGAECLDRLCLNGCIARPATSGGLVTFMREITRQAASAPSPARYSASGSMSGSARGSPETVAFQLATPDPPGLSPRLLQSVRGLTHGMPAATQSPERLMDC